MDNIIGAFDQYNNPGINKLKKVKVEKKDEKKFIYKKNLQKAQAILELIDLINIDGLELKENFKIECYDISNISGKLAVGSMVVFINGIPAKAKYRKFRIKGLDTPDDFKMLKEVFERRFSIKNLKSKDESFSILPDLIIVDGGKGQLSSTYEVIKDLEIDVPIVGLAKKNEDVFKIDSNGENDEFIQIKLKIGSEARFLVQRIRDEAHRFGITYHRDLRRKAQKFSVLNTIPGVGKIVGAKLLKAFGSLEKILKANDEDLYQIIRNKKTLENIKKIKI